LAGAEQFMYESHSALPLAQAAAAKGSEAASQPGASAAEVAKGGANNEKQGKKQREKVNSKDLAKFDIVPGKVRSGEDTRTTVMVRNIPKACTRERFVELLSQFGLGESYTFFYMPFDKNRNIHCGFAFVNFRMPYDVLTLHEGLSTASLRGSNGNAAPPAVSYARLQGQEQLMKHFSLSAVMYDSDARKRPVFVGPEGEGDRQQETSKKGGGSSAGEGPGAKANYSNYARLSENTNSKTSSANSDSSQGLDRMPAKVNIQKSDAQPRYVFSQAMKGMKNFPPGLGPAAQLETETANFLLSSAVGA